MADRRRLTTLILAATLIAPVIVFFVIQALSASTRSGSVEDVWFVRTDAGPRLVARDQIQVGVQSASTVRHRLVLVDLATGERLGRRKVDVPLELVGVDKAGLWFRRKGDATDLHLRDARTLDRVESGGARPPPPTPPTSAYPSTAQEAILPGGAKLSTAALDAARFPSAGFVAGARVRDPILLTDPPSALVVSTVDRELHLSRVDADGKPLWDATLENQRVLRSAARVGEVVVLVTSGAARDFAIAIDLQNGATRWVHAF